MGSTPATPNPFLFQGIDDDVSRRAQEAEKWADFIGVQIVTMSTSSTAGTITTSTVNCNYATQLHYGGYVTNESAVQAVYFTLDGTSVGPAFTVAASATVQIGFTSTALTAAGHHLVTLVAASSYTAAQIVMDRRRPVSMA